MEMDLILDVTNLYPNTLTPSYSHTNQSLS